MWVGGNGNLPSLAYWAKQCSSWPSKGGYGTLPWPLRGATPVDPGDYKHLGSLAFCGLGGLWFGSGAKNYDEGGWTGLAPSDPPGPLGPPRERRGRG